MNLIFSIQSANTTVKDTLSKGYEIGHAIGSYLPVLFLIVLIIIFIRKTYRFEK